MRERPPRWLIDLGLTLLFGLLFLVVFDVILRVRYGYRVGPELDWDWGWVVKAATPAAVACFLAFARFRAEPRELPPPAAPPPGGPLELPRPTAERAPAPLRPAPPGPKRGRPCAATALYWGGGACCLTGTLLGLAPQPAWAPLLAFAGALVCLAGLALHHLTRRDGDSP